MPAASTAVGDQLLGAYRAASAVADLLLGPGQCCQLELSWLCETNVLVGDKGEIVSMGKDGPPFFFILLYACLSEASLI